MWFALVYFEVFLPPHLRIVHGHFYRENKDFIIPYEFYRGESSKAFVLLPGILFS